MNEEFRTLLALSVALSLPLGVAGCTANVADTADVVDDDAPETDETSVKEDSSVRPAGRFEVSYFDQTEADTVGVGFTYGL